MAIDDLRRDQLLTRRAPFPTTCFAVCLFIWAVCTVTHVHAVPIPHLFNTGVSVNGVPLSDGSIDPHYQLIVNSDGPLDDAIIHDGSVFPIVAGPWVPNTMTSKWISPRFDSRDAAGLAFGGKYVYRTAFSLSGFDPTATQISGSWAVDNIGVDIRLNGVSLGISNVPGFSVLTPFSIPQGSPFVVGLNILDFELQNLDPVAGYTGLHVNNLVGSTRVIPEPSSWLLCTIGGSVGVARRLVRRRRCPNQVQ